MATHSSILAWRIPMDRGGSCRIGHDWNDLAPTHTHVHIHAYVYVFNN